MRILYATDGSAGAVAAADLLQRLRLTAEDSVLLLAVQSSGGEEVFRESMGRLQGTSAALETQVTAGQPADRILEVAKERSVDLIVLGAMGASGLARFLMGSVAERVLRHAKTSVLIARPVRNDLQEVLIAIDRSEMAQSIAGAAARLPLPPETELRLTTVIPHQEAVASIAPMVWASLPGQVDSLLKGAVDEAEEHLRTVARGIQKGGRNVSAEVLRGEPEHCLIAASDDEGADLLILGSHGEGGLDRYLLGAVSERVARHAHCSVLLVR
jgi:nucleotide-binding universal stress UspA family protein